MHKFTKIVATLGPASDSIEKIENLILAGVNVFRFNFKHNTINWHSERIERAQKVAKSIPSHVGFLLDLQGPEIRIRMPFESLSLLPKEEILLDEEVFSTNAKGFSITHPSIIPFLIDGQEVLADDGTFVFKVKKFKGKCYLVSESEGILLTNKTLNIPSSSFPLPVITERDRDGIKLAAKFKLDYLALSFVRSALDIQILKKEMLKQNVKAKIVAKIETALAIENLKEIVKEVDAVMVARGDLGVELPIERVPHFQKQIIKECLLQGKTVITATQMLQSMVASPSPTRAEVSDVANAIFDKTDAIMLSAESASGKYPLKSVQIMTKTAHYNERVLEIEDIRHSFSFSLNTQAEMICDASYDFYLKTIKQKGLGLSAVIVFTETGKTAQLLSRYHLKIPVIAFCTNNSVARMLSLNYGIFPVVAEAVFKKNTEITSDHLKSALKLLISKKILLTDERVLVLHGDYWSVIGGTSTIKLIRV